MKKAWVKSLCVLAPYIFSQCSSPEKEIPLKERPNILLAVGDDISYFHMGAYGCDWVKTPGFDRVAGDGILFMNAYTPNAKSAPSRSCLLTGRNSWQLEQAANHVPYFPHKFTTFIEALTKYGYTTGYTGKGWAPGIAADSAGNLREMTGKPYNKGELIPPATGISTNDYASNFEDFLNSRDLSKPFCFWYGSLEPHRKYQYGSGIASDGKQLSDIDHVPGFLPDDRIVRTDLLDYAFEIEHFDSQLVRMLDLLQKRGELQNTIVIITADNGMPFPRAKGQAYEYSNHMPLAIMWQKGIRNPGRVLYDYISFIDIAPTILEVAGVDQKLSGMQPIEGKSMTGIFYSRKNGFSDKSRDHILIGRERNDVGRPDDAGYPVRGIVKEGYLFLVNFKPSRWPSGDPETGYLDCDGSPVKALILDMRRSGQMPGFWKLCFGIRPEEELYNIASDPDCIRNLAPDPGYNPLKQRMRAQMVQELERQKDPRILGNGDIFDKYPYASDKVRDFYNRFMKGKIPASAADWVDSTDFENISY